MFLLGAATGNKENILIINDSTMNKEFSAEVRFMTKFPSVCVFDPIATVFVCLQFEKLWKGALTVKSEKDLLDQAKCQKGAKATAST